MKHNHYQASPKHLLAMIIIFIAVLSVCFYITNLSAENRKFVKENQDLRVALKKERQDKIRFFQDIKELEQRLLNERKARA